MEQWTVKDKVCLVTGASSGIGLEIARGLAKNGAHLFLACRSKEKTEKVIEDLEKEFKDCKVEFLPLDLESLESARQCAQTFLEKNLPLHVLVLNAGAFYPKLEKTADGFEKMFQVNYLSQFLLCIRLLPKLKESAPSRIVQTCSDSFLFVRPRQIDLDNDLDGKLCMVKLGFPLYGRSKLFQLYFMQALAPKLENSGVTINSYHPGAINTGIVNGAASSSWHKIIKPFAKLTMILFFSSAEEGASHGLNLILKPEFAKTTNQFFNRNSPYKLKGLAEDQVLIQKVWDLSFKLTGENPF